MSPPRQAAESSTMVSVCTCSGICITATATLRILTSSWAVCCVGVLHVSRESARVNLRCKPTLLVMQLVSVCLWEAQFLASHCRDMILLFRILQNTHLLQCTLGHRGPSCVSRSKNITETRHAFHTHPLPYRSLHLHDLHGLKNAIQWLAGLAAGQNLRPPCPVPRSAAAQDRPASHALRSNTIICGPHRVQCECHPSARP